MAACRINKILTYGLQHGTHCCMSPAFRANGFQGARNHAFDHFLLWSPFFVEHMDKCSSIFSHANMQVGGFPKGLIPIKSKRSTGITTVHPKVRVMFVIEDYALRRQPLNQVLWHPDKYFVGLGWIRKFNAGQAR